MHTQSIERQCQEHLKKGNEAWEQCDQARKKAEECFQVSSDNLRAAMALIQTTLEGQGCTNVRVEVIQDETSIQGFDITCENDNGVQHNKIYVEEKTNV